MDEPVYVKLTEDDFEAVRRLIGANSAIKEWETIRDKARAQIVGTVGDGIGIYEGKPVVKVTPVTTTRFDTARFTREHPHMAAEYKTATTQSHRVTAPLKP